MRKLFLKVYLPLVICIIITLVLSIFAVIKIIPAQMTAYRHSVEQFRTRLLSSGSLDRNAIAEMARDLDFDINIRPGTVHLQHIPPPEGFYNLPGMPPDFPWRIELSGGPRGGPWHFLRKSFWLILLLLLIIEGLVLFLALRPVGKRLARLQWAASELGSGNLGIKLQINEKGDLIDDLGNTFNSMGGQIKSLVESHQELLGIVAHELRTPMARIRFALELIKEDSEEKNLSKIDRMEEDLIALDNLVTELLDFNKLRRKSKITPAVMNLAELCREMIQSESWARDDVEIVLHGSASCSGDYSLVSRAVGNLIRNAVNYAESKVSINISELSSAGRIRISISDDGGGYDPNLIDRLGKPFAKGPASSGTGLGLAIAGRIAALHGGKVLFGSSKELGGAEAVLELPSKKRNGD